ncbi:MAG: RidA family protein [Actinomycetaceae bacterium]|nr:RidA family protein [Arcanobacterium sp.]MDD7505650.1 RidA family protein [Actinomycetaceae bacterium]MDY6143434.1 RidA family protein [Arcanobacterium sp.]
MAPWNERLSELGIELPDVAAPVAAYVPAQRIGNEIRTSGQLPFVDGELAATGKVGEGDGFVAPEQAKDLARVAILNALAAAAREAGGIDHIARISHVTGFVASDPGFSGQPAVVNGASELLGEIFGDAGAHTRSAVGVAVLPLDAPVEIELTVIVE